MDSMKKKFVLMAHRRGCERLLYHGIGEGLIGPEEAHDLVEKAGWNAVRFMEELLPFVKDYAENKQEAQEEDMLEFSMESWERAVREVKNSVENEALSLEAKSRFVLDRDVMMLREYEQWASFDGHPYHPTAKCKIPWTREQVIRYSPEFGGTVKIIWGAIKREHACVSTNLNLSIDDYLISWFPEEMEAWEQEYGRDEYVPLPIHPANLEFTSAVVRNKDIITECWPTMSFRTVVPTGGEEKKPHIKLPVKVQASSTLRYVSPVEAHDTPILSRVLETMIRAKQDVLENTIEILNEGMGIHDSHIDYELGRYTSVIFRENPYESKCDPETEVVIPLAVIFANNGEFLRTHNYPDGMEEFFRNYAKIVLKGQFGLWAHCAVVLEAHQQNCLLVFSKETGHLVKTLYRDICGGMCALDTTWDKWSNNSKLHPRADYILDDGWYRYMLGALHHTTLKSNLIPLARVLPTIITGEKRRPVVTVSKLLSIVRDLMQEILSHPDVCQEHAAKTSKYLLENNSRFKCLLFMRCCNTKDEVYHQLDYNDLVDPHPPNNRNSIREREDDT